MLMFYSMWVKYTNQTTLVFSPHHGIRSFPMAVIPLGTSIHATRHRNSFSFLDQLLDRGFLRPPNFIGARQKHGEKNTK